MGAAGLAVGDGRPADADVRGQARSVVLLARVAFDAVDGVFDGCRLGGYGVAVGRAGAVALLGVAVRRVSQGLYVRRPFMYRRFLWVSQLLVAYNASHASSLAVFVEAADTADRLVLDGQASATLTFAPWGAKETLVETPHELGSAPEIAVEVTPIALSFVARHLGESLPAFPTDFWIYRRRWASGSRR